MPKKVFISGPVSGRVYEEAKAEFDSVAYEIKKKHGDAVEVVNPFDFCRKGEPWEQAMRKRIARLTECDYIHFLPNFYMSEGARLEMTNAEKFKMGICNDILELVDYDAGEGEK